MASTDFQLPFPPFGSPEYTIVRWLKRAGAAVSAGEPLLVVVNDRLELALPASCAGVLDRVFSAAGAVVAAGVRIATVEHMLVAAGDPPEAAQLPMAEVEQASPARIADSHVPPSGVRISPVARRIAQSANVDITQMRGSGVSGRITKVDLLAALASQPTAEVAPHDSSTTALSPTPIRHLASADAYVLTAIELDMERAALAIAQHGSWFARRRLELSYRVCVALAAVAALPAHPLLNSYWADSTIVIRRRVHLAMLAADGISARTICDAQDLNLRGLARELSGAAAQQHIEQATFTIVDLGDHIWADLAALAQGAAMLGIGAVRARPLVIDQAGERLAIRHTALLTLAYDARVLGQCQADAFLRDLKRHLEQFRV